ncbi:glycosyltransferase [Candidatus Pelagibacter sp.]|nr:glycosyltransferase [Candidatus Pelagibacter sp.]
MSSLQLSIIIPTWNRKKKLANLLSLIKAKIANYKIKYEIIICDSFSKDGSELFVLNLFHQDKNIIYKNIKKNNISAKRNHGIKHSSYDNILLLDDDCFPIGKFFQILQNYLNQNSKNKIFCAQYSTQNRLINNSNYYKFRDDKNLKTKISKNINFRNIITGCCFFNKKKISKEHFFNEKIIGYGLEDVDWANKLFKKKVQIILTEAKVDHQETSGNIGPYLMKWYILSRDAMPSLLQTRKINYSGKIFFFENFYQNKIFKTILNIFIKLIILPLSIVLKYYLSFVDSKKFLYSKTLYNLSIVMYYLRGANDRRKNLFKKSSWYNSGYK